MNEHLNQILYILTGYYSIEEYERNYYRDHKIKWGFSGMEEVGYVYFNCWADPYLIYKGYAFNQISVDESLYCWYEGEDEDFDAYYKDNLIETLEEMIENEYYVEKLGEAL